MFLSMDWNGVGGIPRYSRYMVRALRSQMGPDGVVVLSLSGADAKRRPPGFDGRLRPRMQLTRRCLWQAVRHRPSVVMVDHINLAPLGWLCARLGGSSLWINVYGIEVWGDLSLARRLALFAANGIISDCLFTKTRLEALYGGRLANITVIPDCVDLAIFQTETTIGDMTHELPVSLLTVSRLVRGRDKGHRTVLRALSLLSDEHLWGYTIVGDGNDRQDLLNEVRQLGLEDRVRFTGPVSDEELVKAYASCNVFVLISRFSILKPIQGEGIPLAVLEAQALGKPVLTSRSDGSAESIIDGLTGYLVSPDDPLDIRRRLAELISDGRLRRRMGIAALTRIRSEFSYEQFESRVLQALFNDGRSMRRAP